MTTLKKTAPLPIDDPRALRDAVKVERYAELLAHVMHYRGEDLFEVVGRLGLTPEEWYAIDAAWTGELSLGMKRMQRDQALRFSSTLTITRKRLMRAQPPLASIGEAPAAPQAVAPAPQPASPPLTPIYTPVAPIDERLSPWAARASVVPPLAAVAPLAPSAPSPAPPLQAVPLANARTLGSTADISAFVPRQALPFTPAPAAPPPAPPPAPAPAPPEPTQRMSALPDSPPPGKMLMRFNPDTGEPLPTPIWVDIPPKPADS